MNFNLLESNGKAMKSFGKTLELLFIWLDLQFIYVKLLGQERKNINLIMLGTFGDVSTYLDLFFNLLIITKTYIF